MIPHEISWSRTARAVKFYRSNGFCYVETPWVVPKITAQVTFPDDSLPDPVHVGSAEQGFLDLMFQSSAPDPLPSGYTRLHPGQPYVSAGPCFRPQDAILEDHNPWFFKVELFIFGDPQIAGLLEPLIHKAEAYFESELSIRHHEQSRRVPTLEGVDLYLGDLEIGSYGVRTHDGRTWVYGTGLAEPRFSLAMTRVS